MHLKDLLSELARHAEWADATMWQTVLEAAGDEPPVLDSKVGSWLHHIHLVQHAFPCLWRGEPPELSEVGDFEDTRALVDWARGGHVDLQAFLAGVDDAELDRELEIPWEEELLERWDRPIGAVSVGRSALQVAMHSTHHRGQVAARLRELGAEPPMTDYIAWVWFGKPGAEWPAST